MVTKIISIITSLCFTTGQIALAHPADSLRAPGTKRTKLIEELLLSMGVETVETETLQSINTNELKKALGEDIEQLLKELAKIASKRFRGDIDNKALKRTEKIIQEIITIRQIGRETINVELPEASKDYILKRINCTWKRSTINKWWGIPRTIKQQIFWKMYGVTHVLAIISLFIWLFFSPSASDVWFGYRDIYPKWLGIAIIFSAFLGPPIFWILSYLSFVGHMERAHNNFLRWNRFIELTFNDYDKHPTRIPQKLVFKKVAQFKPLLKSQELEKPRPDEPIRIISIKPPETRRVEKKAAEQREGSRRTSDTVTTGELLSAKSAAAEVKAATVLFIQQKTTASLETAA